MNEMSAPRSFSASCSRGGARSIEAEHDLVDKRRQVEYRPRRTREGIAVSIRGLRLRPEEQILLSSTHDKLLCSLPAFEVVYVATTPELFKAAQHLFRRLFPRPVTHLKNVPAISGQISPIIPRAELTVELIVDCYPSFLESDPVCDAVWFRERLGEQKSLFSSEVPNDAI